MIRTERERDYISREKNCSEDLKEILIQETVEKNDRVIW